MDFIKMGHVMVLWWNDLRMPRAWQVTHLCVQDSVGSQAQAEGREGRRVFTVYPSGPAQGTVSTLRKVDEYMDVHPLALSFTNVQAALILGYIQL